MKELRENKSRIFVGIFIILFLLLGFSCQSYSVIFSQSDNFELYDPTKIVVGFRQNVTNEEIAAFIKENECKLIGNIRPDFRAYGVILPEGKTYNQIKKKFLEDERVEYVIPGYYMQAQSTAVDDIVGLVRENNKEFLQRIRLLEAIEYVKREGQFEGKDNVVIAVIDYTGLHPDLIEQLKQAEIYKPGLVYIEKDNKGEFIEDEEGIKEYSGGHNTQVTTLLSGIGKGIKIMPVKFDGTLTTYIAAIQAAIDKAKTEGKKLVINSSVNISLEGFMLGNMKSSLEDYLIGRKIKNLRQEGKTDMDIASKWNRVSNDAKEITDHIIEQISDLTHKKMTNWEDIFDYIDWENIKEMFKNYSLEFDLNEIENVLTYAEFAAGQSFDYFKKKPLCEEFKRYAKEAVIINSAGNFNNDLFNFPASYSSVISVGANYKTKKAGYSNFGDWVDIYAPGGDFGGTLWTQTILNGGLKPTYNYRGTSFSAPLVSQIASLIFSEYPQISTEEVRDIITHTSDRIFDIFDVGEETKQIYIKRVNVLDSVKVARSYGGIIEIFKAIEEFVSETKVDEMLSLDPGDEKVALSIKGINLMEQFNQALSRIFSEDPGLLSEHREEFDSIINRLILGEFTAIETKNALLEKLWEISPKDSILEKVTGLAINNRGSKESISYIARDKFDNLGDWEINEIIDIVTKFNDGKKDIFSSINATSVYQGVIETIASLQKVNSSSTPTHNISLIRLESAFMSGLERIFSNSTELLERNEDKLMGILDRLYEGNISFSEAKSKVLKEIWSLGEESGVYDLVKGIASYIDIFKDMRSLADFIKFDFPELEHEEIEAILESSDIEGESLTLTSLFIANSYNAIKNIFNAIDEFKSSWPKDWVSPLDYISISEVRNWEEWSQYLDQLVNNTEYMSDENIFGAIEEFYTKMVENFIAVFSQQGSLSGEFYSNNLLHQLIWRYVVGDITKEDAKIKVVELVQKEVKIPSIEIALDIIRERYGLEGEIASQEKNVRPEPQLPSRYEFMLQSEPQYQFSPFLHNFSLDFEYLNFF